MGLAALNMNLTSLVYEKSQLEFQEMIMSVDYNDILSQMTSYLSSNSNNKATDSYYVQLQNQQQQFDSQKSQIESKLKVINAQIEGFQKAVDERAKGSKLNISV